MDDPTRGVDVGTKRDIYQLVRDEAAKGRTFIWYTTENEELTYCDRTYVFRSASVTRLLHADESVLHDAHRFDPDRFMSRRPDPADWIPYGGGVRRCIGAAFATMEIRVVLRTLLRDYTISPSNARDEGWQSRGVALAPSRGALVRVRRRRAIASSR